MISGLLRFEPLTDRKAHAITFLRIALVAHIEQQLKTVAANTLPAEAGEDVFSHGLFTPQPEPVVLHSEVSGSGPPAGLSDRRFNDSQGRSKEIHLLLCQDLHQGAGVPNILGLAILVGVHEGQLLRAVEQETAHPHGGSIQPASLAASSSGLTRSQEEDREESEGERETGGAAGRHHSWGAVSLILPM